MVSGLIKNELNSQKGVTARANRRADHPGSEADGSVEIPKLLACLVNLDKGKIHTLTDDELSIGRSSSCDILINTDATVSRKHAIITMAQGDFFLEDLGSRNGTTINGDLVQGRRVKLSPDDQIHIGKTVYVFSPVGISEALYGAPNKDLEAESRISVARGARKLFTGLFECVFNRALKLPKIAVVSGDQTIQSRAVSARKQP